MTAADAEGDAEGDVVANLYHVTSNDHPDSWSVVRGL